MPITLNSLSPVSGPPGTAITCVGAGFDAGAQVGCPTLQPTALNGDGSITASVPADLSGPDGGSTPIAVFVLGSDGSVSATQMFTVQFGPTKLQTWTDIDAVCGMVPGFNRGGRISDDRLNEWMEGEAQAIAAVMLKRGLPSDPTLWQQPTPGAMPSPAGLLELINRLGAAAQLAAAIGAQFSAGAEWAVAKDLRTKYADEITTLRDGEYDKLFLPSAATVEAGPQLAAYTGCHPAFRKDQVF